MMGKESGLVGYLGMEKMSVAGGYAPTSAWWNPAGWAYRNYSPGDDEKRVAYNLSHSAAQKGRKVFEDANEKMRQADELMARGKAALDPANQKAQIAAMASDPSVQEQIMNGIFSGKGDIMQRLARHIMSSESSPFLLKMLAGLFYGPKAQGWGNYFFGNANDAKDTGTQPPASTTPPVTPPVTPPAGAPTTPPANPPAGPQAGAPATPPANPQPAAQQVMPAVTTNPVPANTPAGPQGAPAVTTNPQANSITPPYPKVTTNPNGSTIVPTGLTPIPNVPGSAQR
jgi:hypothetical protein